MPLFCSFESLITESDVEQKLIYEIPNTNDTTPLATESPTELVQKIYS
jgi:hypothetical protein